MRRHAPKRKMGVASAEQRGEIPALLSRRLSRCDLFGLGAQLQVGGTSALEQGSRENLISATLGSEVLPAHRGSRVSHRVPNESAFFLRKNGVARCGPKPGWRPRVRARSPRLVARHRVSFRALSTLDRSLKLVAAKAKTRSHVANGHRVRLHRSAGSAHLRQTDCDEESGSSICLSPPI